MSTIRKPVALAVALTLIGAAACVRTPISAEAMVSQCQNEVAPAGTYEYDEGPQIPTMRAVADGTEAGAAAFNACIRQKAAEDGLIAMTSTGQSNSFCPKGASTLYGGVTYCIGAK